MFTPTPYYWLNRETVDKVVNAFDVDYDDERERFVDGVLGGFEPDWIMHGDNQKALIERFFREVSANDSLVFFYVKHSPLGLFARRRVPARQCGLGSRAWSCQAGGRQMSPRRFPTICGRQPCGTRFVLTAPEEYSCQWQSLRDATRKGPT